MPDAYKFYKFAEFVLNPVKRTLFNGDSEIKLNDKEFDVLLFLIEDAPRFCSFDEIIKTVWNGTNVSNNSIEKIITNIRKALGDNAKEPRFIRTGRGKGYSFVCDVQAIEENTPAITSENFKKIRPKKIVSNKRIQSPNKFSSFKVFALCLTIIIFISFLGIFFAVGIWARFNTTTIFTDEFSGEKIDPNRWTVKGRTVKVENGIAKLVVEETDNGGRVESAYFSFDTNKPITIKSRIKVAYSQNLKDKFYFHGYFCLSPKTSLTDESEIKDYHLFGVNYANYDYEEKYPDGNTKEHKAEGFFLVKKGGMPHIRTDYEVGNISPRIEPTWNKWFEQKIVYEPFTGKLSYFIDGEFKADFNVEKFSTDLQENKLRLEINPEGWWLYHSIEIDYIEVTQ